MSSYLPQGFVNTSNQLSFAVVNSLGFLESANYVGFRIIGEDGNQVFPVASGVFEEVTTGDGVLGTGRYFAFDEASGEGWAVPDDATVGEWTIQWKWRLAASGAFSIWNYKFDVVASYDSGTNTGFRGVSFRTYISPLRVRLEGLDPLEFSDPRIEGLILDAQAYVERETRNVFRPVFDSVRMNGNDVGKLFLGLPILGVESVKVGTYTRQQSSVVLSFARADREDVHTSKPDPRRLPSISFSSSSNIFSGSTFSEGDRFVPGNLNHSIDALWGFLESDGTVPRLIQSAMLKLVYATAYTLDEDADSQVAGPLKSRVVDRHSESWEPTPSGMLKRALAHSKEVEESLMFYKAPIAMAATTQRNSRLRL